MSAKVGPAGSIEPTEMAAYGATLPFTMASGKVGNPPN
jgi:hypothetical protein